jgi:colanic acid/amylovoran biosynthesis protein
MAAGMRLKKILLTNSHSTNMGDMAIVLAMLGQFRRLSPDTSIALHCSHVGTARKFVSGVELHGYLLPMFDRSPTLSDCVSVGFSFAANLLSAAIFRLSGRKVFLSRSHRDSLNDFFDSDVVVSIGGGFLSYDYGFLRPYYDFTIAKILGKRLVLYGQSIGPFHGLVARTISRVILGSADIILLREARSAEYLAGLGLKNFTVTSDAAFSLPHSPAKRKKPERPRLVVVPRKWTYPHRAVAEAYVSFIARLSERFMAEQGGTVAFLPTTRDDVQFFETLRPRMPQGVEYLDVMHPHEIADRLAGADFLVSSRMHPIVLGCLSSTPFFAAGWEYKLDELSKQLSPSRPLSSSEFNDSTVDGILERISEREAIREELSVTVPEAIRKSGENLEILRARLLSWGYRL